jgi:hypothetical protein
VSREFVVKGLGAALAALALAAGGDASVFAAEALPRTLPAEGYEPRKGKGEKLKVPQDQAKEWRRNALGRAKVWAEPEVPVASADLRSNPAGPGAFPDSAELPCKFLPGKTTGASPKFDCVFEGGDVLKVKYGGKSPEVYTEVAATRLLRALGFGADDVYAVRRVRCFGCPEDPHSLLQCLSTPFEQLKKECAANFARKSPSGALVFNVDTAKFTDFERVAIERRMPGQVIEVDGQAGWGWDELDEEGKAPLGATRAERDALRLMAALLNNWDTRKDNQRLTCLKGGATPTRNQWCMTPFGYMHDVGATFGKVGGEKADRKLDIEGWSSVPLWADPAACVVKIDAPRFHGATFGEARISEGGRALLARLLGELDERQMRDLFEGARFAEYEGGTEADRDVNLWVKALQEKVRQIVEGGPCPAS